MIVVSILLGGTLFGPSRSAVGMQQSGSGDEPAGGTPVAAAAESRDVLASDPSQDAPVPSDPHDGDPLDGPGAGRDPGAPVDLTQLEIVRSARPQDEPTTVAAYDDDPETVWVPEADAGETWLWLDLGLERRLRGLRWLAKGRGSIEIAVSNDRRRWRDIERVDVGRGWNGVELRDDARYVRLTLLPTDAGGEFPAIAEAAVYGPDERRSVSVKQGVGDNREQDRGRKLGSDRLSVSAQEADDSSRGNEGRRRSRSAGRVRISAEQGETRCRGDRERCGAQQGEVSVEDDCEREGTCTIDVRAEGGTAVCDAAGGDESKAGDGEGRRGGRGGRCEADANGGAVGVGDVNP
jgi:hypothetical protein